jgi:uncharacterized protein (DUF885 family)
VGSAIFDLCDGYVSRLAALDPVWAGMRGVVGDFGAATDYGPDGMSARTELTRETLVRLDTLRPVDGGDARAADHLRERLGAELAWLDSGEGLRLLSAQFGLLNTLRDSVELMPRADEDGWRAVAARLAAMPRMLAGWRAGLALGLDRGLPGARRQALEAAKLAAGLADGRAFAQLAAAGPAGALAGDLARAADAAHAAFARTARYLREEYAPRADPADGVGAERYRIASRRSLGVDIDPIEAYHWGWDELRRIEAELSAEAHAVRPGASLDEVIAVLDGAEYVDGTDAYQAWLQERHDEAVSRLDGTHFDLHPALRRVEAVLAGSSNSGSAYYTPPGEDLKRPGRTWWPLGGQDRFAVWKELTTVHHEGVPGHHLQLGQARVMGERLSRFSRLSGVSGHGEGWALYAERLADELGWYTGPGRRLGMLTGGALRAARVVIDIGLHLDLPLPAAEAARHGPQWTFEVAAEVLRDRGRAAAHRVHPEVVRYCGLPAQATSYKLGERAWLAARDAARQRLGREFDLKRWHTAALSLGPIGLGGLGVALADLNNEGMGAGSCP